MTQFAPRVIVHSTKGYHSGVALPVEDLRRSGVRLICVTGVECQVIEGIVDELIVGDRSLSPWEVTTTSHPGEALQDVVTFANGLLGELKAGVQVIEV